MSFLCIHIVLLSIHLWRKHGPKSLVFRATDGTDKTSINMCTDKFLSAGIDPRKCSPVDAITLSKPLITLSNVSFCIPETQSHSMKSALGQVLQILHASVKGSREINTSGFGFFLDPFYIISLCHRESFGRVATEMRFSLGDLYALRGRCWISSLPIPQDRSVS